MLFDVRGVRDGAWEIVAVVGEVDLATAPAFRAALVASATTALADGVGLAVDLTGCDLVDSVGLGVVLGGSRRARTGSVPFAVVVPDPRVRAAFERCRLDEVLDLVGDRAALARVAHEHAVRAGGASSGG